MRFADDDQFAAVGVVQVEFCGVARRYDLGDARLAAKQFDDLGHVGCIADEDVRELVIH